MSLAIAGIVTIAVTWAWWIAGAVCAWWDERKRDLWADRVDRASRT